MSASLAVASAVVSASGNSPSLDLGPNNCVAVDINATAGVGSPSMVFYLDRLGADGNWYPIYTSSAVTGVSQTSTSVGPGCATDQLPTNTVRLRWVLGSGTSLTFSASLVGRQV
jgi:hypothetical protein